MTTRTKRNIHIVMIAAGTLLVLTAVALLMACDPVGPPERPTQIPSSVFTVIVPRGGPTPDGGIYDNN